MGFVKYIFGFFILGILLQQCSCNESPVTKLTSPVNTKPQIAAPFHYQKDIEVKPGLTLDIVSWGRGADSTGAYLILRSDSTHHKYTSISGDLKGRVVDTWDMDMDADGNPEIYIQTKDKKGRLNLYVHEFDNAGSSSKLSFPDLSSATQARYRGRDSVYVKDGKLLREFPLYKKEDPDSKPSDGKKVVVYTLNRNDFSVGELDPVTMKPMSLPPAPKKAPAKKKPARRRR